MDFQVDVRILAIVGLLLLVTLGYFSYLLYQDITSLKRDIDTVKELANGQTEGDGEEGVEEYTFEDDSDMYGEGDDTEGYEGEHGHHLEDIPEEAEGDYDETEGHEEGFPEIDEILNEPEPAQDLVEAVKPKRKYRKKEKAAAIDVTIED